MAKATQLNLTKVFTAVQKELANNQAALNQADNFNHNHGDNMVEIFKSSWNMPARRWLLNLTVAQQTCMLMAWRKRLRLTGESRLLLIMLWN